MILALLTLALSGIAHAEVPSAKAPPDELPSISEFCESSLKALPGKVKIEELKTACAQAKQIESCESEEGVRIFHYDRDAKAGEADPKRILVFSLVHGDEIPSGAVARAWMERLTFIEPRNHWRVVPILNPDGLKRKTRTNARGVDINRNFPSKDWDEKALQYWQSRTKPNAPSLISMNINLI